MKLCLLGPWEAQIENRPLHLRGRKAMALLAYLAVEGDYRHIRASLLGLLWPELAEDAARNNLRVVLARLRRALKSTDPPILKSDRHTIWFNQMAEVEFDLAQFEQLRTTTEVHGHARRQSCAACQARLAKAVEFYRGDFMAGFYLQACPAFDEWLFVQREGLRVQVLAMLAELTGFHMDLADYPTAVTYARRQLELDPLQESAHRQLMRLYAYQNRRPAALAQFQTCQRILNQELGVDPESETVLLYQQIKDGALSPSLRLPSKLDDMPRMHQIPLTPTPFIGREEELAQLEERLSARSYRLLAIIGAGGVGKTRLAIEAARNQQHLFAHGALFIPLAELATAEEIPLTVLAAMRLAPPGSTRSIQEFLLASLEDKELLLILDNMEHMMEGVRLLMAILHAAPAVTLMITTREEPQLQAADLFFLDGLPVPPAPAAEGAAAYAAVRLFADRARRVDKRFRLDSAIMPHVIQICRLVEGLPLALELATNALRDSTCAEIAASLADDSSLLETTALDVTRAHRSMQAVFDYSWHLLPAEEQEALAQLAVFRGGFDYPAIRAVTAASRLLVTRLRYKSLLRRQNPDRFDMHYLIRQLAWEKLASPELTLAPAAIKRRHSEYYMKLLARQEEAVNGWRPVEAQQLLSRELDNIRQAWHVALEGERWPLLTAAATTLARFYALSGRYEEGEAVFRKTISIVAGRNVDQGRTSSRLVKLHTRLLVALATCLLEQTKIAESQPLLQEISELAEQCADAHSLAYVQLQLGANLMNQGANAAALPYLERGLAIARENELPRLEGLLLRAVANWWRQRGDYKQFEAHLLQALSLQRAVQNAAEVQTILTWLGVYRRNLGDIWGGRHWLEEAQSMNDQVGDRYREATILAGLGLAYLDVGQFNQALGQLMEARRAYRAINDRWHVAWTMTYVSLCYCYLGAWAMAIDAAGESVSLAQAEQMGEVIARSTVVLAFALAGSGRTAEAARQFAEAGRRWQKIGNQESYLEARAGLAEMALADRQPAQALDQITPVLTHLQENGLSSVLDLFRIYNTCYQILQANGDRRAPTLLQDARRQLSAKAALIDDERARTSFLTNFPAHRQLHNARKE